MIIKCHCGCNQDLRQDNGNYRKRKFIKGHNSRLRTGENNPNFGKRGPETSQWKRGSSICNEYRMLSGCQGHIKADRMGRVYEHIFIYEKYHKCCLLKWGEVHHKNRNKLDNRISNLKGMMSYQHTQIHHPKIDMTNRFCLQCGTTVTRIDKRGYECWHRYKDGFRCVKCYKKSKSKSFIILQ